MDDYREWLYSTGNSTHYSRDLNGKEMQRRGDICVHTAASLCCSAGTNTPLKSNYATIKKKSYNGFSGGPGAFAVIIFLRISCAARIYCMAQETGNSTQYFIIIYKRKESEKEYIYMHTFRYIYTYRCIHIWYVYVYTYVCVWMCVYIYTHESLSVHLKLTQHCKSACQWVFVCVCVCTLSCVWLFVTPWTIAL